MTSQKSGSRAIRFLHRLRAKKSGSARDLAVRRRKRGWGFGFELELFVAIAVAARILGVWRQPLWSLPGAADVC